MYHVIPLSPHNCWKRSRMLGFPNLPLWKRYPQDRHEMLAFYLLKSVEVVFQQNWYTSQSLTSSKSTGRCSGEACEARQGSILNANPLGKNELSIFWNFAWRWNWWIKQLISQQLLFLLPLFVWTCWLNISDGFYQASKGTPFLKRLNKRITRMITG